MVLAIWLGVFALVFVSQLFVTIAPVSTVWTHESRAAFPENEFRVIAFPRDDNVWLVGGEGSQRQRLDRAVVLSLDEWHSDGPIGVFVGPTDIMFVERSDLRLTAADADAEQRLVALAREAHQRFFDPQLDAVRRFEYFSPDIGKHVVNACMTNGDIYTSQYRSEQDSVVIPLRVRLTSASAPQDVPQLGAALRAALFAGIAMGVCWLGFVLRAWWISPRPNTEA
jgi:hypothetical protein